MASLPSLVLLLCLAGSALALTPGIPVALGHYALNQNLGLTQILVPPPINSANGLTTYIYDSYLNTSNGNDFPNAQVDILSYYPQTVWEKYVWGSNHPPKGMRLKKEMIGAKHQGTDLPPLPPYPYSIDRIIYNVSMMCGQASNPGVQVQLLQCHQLTFNAGLDFCESNFMNIATGSGPFARSIGNSSGTIAFGLAGYLGASWNYFYECQSNCDGSFANVCS